MFADIEACTGVTLPTDFDDTLQRRIAEAFNTGIMATNLATLTNRICVASSSTPERLRRWLSRVRLLHRFDPHVTWPLIRAGLANSFLIPQKHPAGRVSFATAISLAIFVTSRNFTKLSRN